ncbi:MAG: hypothetical protein ABSD49_05935 [Candidatus Bathyarchaeia archaeon]|jgi:hypothetical protein
MKPREPFPPEGFDYWAALGSYLSRVNAALSGEYSASHSGIRAKFFAFVFTAFIVESQLHVFA